MLYQILSLSKERGHIHSQCFQLKCGSCVVNCEYGKHTWGNGGIHITTLIPRIAIIFYTTKWKHIELNISLSALRLRWMYLSSIYVKFHFVTLCILRKSCALSLAIVVARSVEWSLLKPDVGGSNPLDSLQDFRYLKKTISKDNEMPGERTLFQQPSLTCVS